MNPTAALVTFPVSGKGRGRDKSWESPERSPLTSDATLRSNLDNRPSSLYFINVSISRVIKCDMCMLKCFNCPPIPSSHRQHVPTLCLPRALSHSHCPTLLGLRSNIYWDQDSTFRITEISFCMSNGLYFPFEGWATKQGNETVTICQDRLSLSYHQSLSFPSVRLKWHWMIHELIHYISSSLPFSPIAVVI